MSLGKEIEAIEMERGLAGMQEHMCKEKFKDIRQRILDGERSDDPVKDFMIVAYSGELKGGHEVLVEQGIKNLQEKIKENQGQQVLVIVDEEKIGGCTGLGGKGYVDLTEIRVLGVINGELNFSYEPRTAFIDLSARCGIGDIVIPTNGYVTFGDMEGFLGIEQRRISDCLTDYQIYPGIIEASDFEKYISNLHRRISTAPVGVLNQPLPLMYVEDQPIMIRVGDDVNRGNSFVS